MPQKKADLQVSPSIAPYGHEDSDLRGPRIVEMGSSLPSFTDQQQTGRDDRLPLSESSTSDEVPLQDSQNLSDALGILARVADSSSRKGESSINEQENRPSAIPVAPTSKSHGHLSAYSYPLLNRGTLTVQTVCNLIVRYQQNYHPFFPLAPAQTFDTTRLGETAEREPHLLTAILVISSKDLVEEPYIYEACSEHMKSLTSNLAIGGNADIEAVEALLLLAEWAPYTQCGSSKVGKGEEDKESWMHLGLALRIAYYLTLDKYSFRVVNQDSDLKQSRKQLVWMFAYVSDQHISVRLGKAFQSRGPGPLITLRREDYPTLIPKNPNEEDYASIFQANLELTQIFSNVHDVLYSNLGSGFRSHLSGSYIKFIDDLRSAIYGWKSVWGTLACSPPLKACLLMSYDYLRLYTNAFAFQATFRHALSTSLQSEEPVAKRTSSLPPIGDGRFVYEGLDAAKAILTTANNFIDPEKSLRYMPLRYYLYVVYAGVFLYRAHCTGVMTKDEDHAIHAMINETVATLQRSSVGTGIVSRHPGSRYSQLLELLWAKVPRKDKTSRSSFHHLGTHIASSPTNNNNGFSHPNTGAANTQSLPQVGSVGTVENPTITENMGDFDWLDLGAVGNFGMNGSIITDLIDDTAFGAFYYF